MKFSRILTVILALLLACSAIAEIDWASMSDEELTDELTKGMTEMMNRYNALSASHVYALGFVYAGSLYAAKLSFAELSAFFKLDRASSKRGGFAKIRHGVYRYWRRSQSKGEICAQYG